MEEIYPYGGFLAYLKYHFIDGVTKQQLMMLDKTRIVYNYKDKKDINKSQLTDKSLSDALGQFGFGKKTSMDKVREEIGG